MRTGVSGLAMALLSVLLGSCRSQSDGKAVPVVITTDCGTEIDDQWALLYAWASPQLDVRGVVTTHSWNLRAPASESSRRCVRDTMASAGVGEAAPVEAGAAARLPAVDEPHDNDGVRFLIESSRPHDAAEPLYIVSLGAMTDVASALLIDPEMADRVHVIAMAFERWPEGGDAWNVLNDLDAARAVLRSGVPLTVVPEAAILDDMAWDRERVREALGERGELAGWLLERTEAFASKAAHLPEDEHVLWDVAAVARLEQLVTTTERGRPRLTDDVTFDHDTPLAGPFHWTTAVDGEGVWKAMLAHLDRLERGPVGLVEPSQPYTASPEIDLPDAPCAEPRSSLDSMLLPRCEPRTRSCIEECAGAAACQQGCYEQDELPPYSSLGVELDCRGCIWQQQLTCFDQGGCHDAVAALMCCFMDECASSDSSSRCGELECGPFLVAMFECVQTEAPGCLDPTAEPAAACFAPDG